MGSSSEFGGGAASGIRRSSVCNIPFFQTGGFKKKDRITQRIPIATLDEIDAEVKKWLKTAYDLDA